MHVTGKMGFHSNCGEKSYDKKASNVKTVSSPQPKQRTKLGSILNLEEYKDDLHPKAVKDAGKSKGFNQKQHIGGTLCKSEEVVRYMSCLPNYLERGESPKDKTFNIGVLDWSQLEKWQHNNADVFGINTEPSHSSSTSTAFVSSKGSSFPLGSDNTLSHHQNLSRPSTSAGVRSSNLKHIAGSGGDFPESRNNQINLLKVQKQHATQSSNDGPNGELDSKSLNPSLQKASGIRLQPSETDNMVSGFEGIGTPQKGKASKAKETVPNSAITDVFSERCKRRVAACHQSGSSEAHRNGLLEVSRFNGGPDSKVSHNNPRPDNNRFCSVINEPGKTKGLTEDKSFKEVRSLNCPSGKAQTIPCTQSASTSPARRRNLEKKNTVSKPRNVARDEVLQMKVDSLESVMVRNPSPTRRFSFGISRIGKSSNSNSLDIPKQVLEVVPDSKATSTSARSNDSSGGKSNATSRARSSPLRRLLDPLLKPKGVETRESACSSQINPSARDGSLKSSSCQRESPALPSVKETVDMKCFRRDDVGRSHQTQKNGASSKQALLQIAVKNGLPLFTFTVDNCRDILAATVKELSPKENTGRWIYTFFSFSETKKKHAQWIKQGSKDRNHGFVSNIVALMKVYDIVDPDLTGKGCDKSGRREFILSAVGTRGEEHPVDTLPCDELAAVVVKYPERICEKINQDRQQYTHSTSRGLKEPCPRYANRSSAEDNGGNECGSDRPFSTTVILPGGHHGVPSKGEPSPLIKRWKTGGSCDCGGWDLGCQLTILTGSNESIKSQSSAVKLFSQEQGEKPVFVVSPFEEGIFSIEFDSSLKLIQAFSIAISVVHSRSSVFLSSGVVGETAAPENSVSKIFNGASVEVTAKYASNPPLSPAGRV